MNIFHMLYFDFFFKEIGNLKKLRYFDITENVVEWIADELGECCSMTDLHFSTNNIESLPENLCKYMADFYDCMMMICDVP